MSLKRIKRTGWVEKNITEAESAADHTFGVTLLAATVPLPKDVDRNQLIKMALSHDLGETIIGDIKWESGNSANIDLYHNKIAKERQAIAEAFETMQGHELETYAIEYLEKDTPASKFLKQLDKLEMTFQALAYEQDPNSNAENLDEFWINAEKYITDEFLKEIFTALQKQRQI